MYIDKILNGKYIKLQAVSLNDAEFIVKIRNDEMKKKYVHAVPNSVEKQKEWITKQIQRKDDYYFVIKDNDDNSVGLASIYDVGLWSGGAEFGRWISWGNSLQNVESVILSFDFAFDVLNVDYVYMRTMKDNEKVKRFWRQFGAELVGDVYEMNMWLSKSIVTKKVYHNSIREKMTRLLKY